MLQTTEYTHHISTENRAFLYGDMVKVFFYVHQSELIMEEECYFYLMASMRKMRMSIPMTFTMDFFQKIFDLEIQSSGIVNGVIALSVYREASEKPLSKSNISYTIARYHDVDVLSIQKNIEMDLMKEITLNTHLLSNIHTHCPENIYAQIYASENDLDDVIMLNPNKRIARAYRGNLLFLEENTIKIPKQTEGAYISPLMENFVTYLHKNHSVDIESAELSAFETQKAEEILLVSDEFGLFSVHKIRNKTFANKRFYDWVSLWRNSFSK